MYRHIYTKCKRLTPFRVDESLLFSRNIDIEVKDMETEIGRRTRGLVIRVVE